MLQILAKGHQCSGGCVRYVQLGGQSRGCSNQRSDLSQVNWIVGLCAPLRAVLLKLFISVSFVCFVRTLLHLCKHIIGCCPQHCTPMNGAGRTGGREHLTLLHAQLTSWTPFIYFTRFSDNKSEYVDEVDSHFSQLPKLWDKLLSWSSCHFA